MHSYVQSQFRYDVEKYGLVCLCVRDNIELSKHTRSNKYNTLHACARSHTRPNTNLLIAFHIYSNLFALGMRGTLWKCESKSWACNKSDNPWHKTRLQTRCYCQFPNYRFFSVSSFFRHVDVIDIGSCRNLLFCYMLHTHKMHSSLTMQTCQSRFGCGCVCVCVCYACYFRYTMQSDLLCFYPDFPFFSCDLFCVFRFRHNSIKSIAVWDGKI